MSFAVHASIKYLPAPRCASWLTISLTDVPADMRRPSAAFLHPPRNSHCRTALRQLWFAALDVISTMSYVTNFWTSTSPEPGCLMFTDNCESTGSLSVGGWCVPIMWSTCFSGGDVNVVLTPQADWSEPDHPEYGASCDTTIASAVLRVEERLPSVLRILPEHTHEACNLFLCRLQKSKAKYVHTEISLLLSNEEDPPTFKP